VKVGALDDPVWEQSPDSPVPSQGRRPRWSRRRWRSVVILVGLLVLLAVGLTLWTSQPGPPGGDPGGRILRALQPASAAVPDGSTNVAMLRSDSGWSPACPDNSSGQAGWSAVRVSTSFTNALPREQIVGAVNSALVGEGWTRHDESFGPGQGVVAHWTKRLTTGTPAEAAVYPVPAGSTNWVLTATSKPPGFALPGC
jgi:hypothetical protein